LGRMPALLEAGMIAFAWEGTIVVMVRAIAVDQRRRR
jgi:hypothetical protein